MSISLDLRNQSASYARDLGRYFKCHYLTGAERRAMGAATLSTSVNSSTSHCVLATECALGLDIGYGLFHRYNAVYSCTQFLQFLACRVFQDTWAAQTINGDCLAETPPQMKCALHAAFVQILFFKSCKGKWSCTGGLC